MILRVIGPNQTSVEMKSAVSKFQEAEICQMQSTRKSHMGKPVKVLKASNSLPELHYNKNL